MAARDVPANPLQEIIDATRAKLSDAAVAALVAAGRLDPERTRSRLEKDIAELSQEIEDARGRMAAVGATQEQMSKALGPTENFIELYRRVLKAI
jgi:hypothetical protein